MEGQDWSLHDLVRSIGLNRTYAGYRYLVYSLELLREDPERLDLITKRLYPDVARKFDTSSGGVDRALRTAASVCCKHSPELLKDAETTENGSVSVREFLRILSGLDRRRERNGRAGI